MGPSVVHVASRLASRRPSWSALSRHVTDWTAPPLPRTVRLLPRPAPHAGAEVSSGTLRAELAGIGVPVRRTWRVAVLRRALLSALVVGLILAFVDTWLGWPRWCAPALAAVSAGALTAALMAAGAQPRRHRPVS